MRSNEELIKVHPLLEFLDESEGFKLSSIFEVWEKEYRKNNKDSKTNEGELNKESSIKEFISYAVGCMVGRYSVDVTFIIEKRDDGYHGIYSKYIDSLIYDGGVFEDKWNLEEKLVRKIERDDKGVVISASWVDANFLPYENSMVPITEDIQSEDNIVSRFIYFVKLYFGAEDLDENLDFIANSIGRKNKETTRETISGYFVEDFYKDHLRTYKNNPLYCIGESEKTNGIRMLVYMNRYKKH